MSYESLSPKQKQVVNLLFDYPGRGEGGCIKWVAKQLGVSANMVKANLTVASRKYNIPLGKYRHTVRLVYLRAKELGLI